MSELSALHRCFQGVIPAVVATCARDGMPNVTYISHVYFVDETHVALSRQFLNKTSQNVAENPYACVQLLDPVTLAAYEIDLRFDRSETSGPVFDTMAIRIQAIASHTGMSGVFKLIAADVYEVTALREVSGFQASTAEEAAVAAPPGGPPSFRSELRALQEVSRRLTGEGDLEKILSSLLSVLKAELGFEHSRVLLLDESGGRLYTVASLGYGDDGIGAEVAVGEGLIGTVAQRRKILSMSDLDGDIRYGRAIRHEVHASGAGHTLRPEIPLPGLPDAQSHIAIPLQARERLIGVLAVESRDPACFEEWHEAFLGIVANQAAVAIENGMLRDDADDSQEHARPHHRSRRAAASRTRRFTFYKNDDCVFVDDEYLIRNLPGRIFWKILRSYVDGKRTGFSNRELRLDASLGLPPIKDNLESRLILLRKRLEQKCPDVRLPSCGRGRFRIQIDCDVELVEKDSA